MIKVSHYWQVPGKQHYDHRASRGTELWGEAAEWFWAFSNHEGARELQVRDNLRRSYPLYIKDRA